MSIPSSVHFHNMDRSPALETDIKNHVESLSQFFDRIIDCHMTIDAPHRHHHKGLRYKVVINISVPGDTLVVVTKTRAVLLMMIAMSLYAMRFAALADSFRTTQGSGGKKSKATRVLRNGNSELS